MSDEPRNEGTMSTSESGKNEHRDEENTEPELRVGPGLILLGLAFLALGLLAGVIMSAVTFR